METLIGVLFFITFVFCGCSIDSLFVTEGSGIIFLAAFVLLCITIFVLGDRWR